MKENEYIEVDIPKSFFCKDCPIKNEIAEIALRKYFNLGP